MWALSCFNLDKRIWKKVTLAIPAHERQKKTDEKFKVNFCYIANSKFAWAARDFVFKPTKHTNHRTK